MRKISFIRSNLHTPVTAIIWKTVNLRDLIDVDEIEDADSQELEVDTDSCDKFTQNINQDFEKDEVEKFLLAHLPRALVILNPVQVQAAAAEEIIDFSGRYTGELLPFFTNFAIHLFRF